MANAVSAYGMTETIDPKSGNKVLTDSSGKVLSITDKSGNQVYSSGYNVQESAQTSQQAASTSPSSTKAGQSAALAVIRNKIASCKPGSSRYNYYIKQYKAFGGVINGESNLEETTELNNSSWMVSQSQQLKKLSNYVSEGIAQAAGSVSLGISNVGESAISEIQDWKAQMNQTLKPMGMGSAIGDMTELVKNPLGAPQFLTNSVIALVDKINPGFTNEMDAAFKSSKLDNLQHLPSKMMGSVRNLATAADDILSVPFEIMSDVYNGLMDIMESISEAIDGIMSAVTDFFFGPDGLLDSIFPISELLELFSAIGELASFVGGISQMTGGFAAVTDIAGQVQSYASSASSALSNPLQLAMAYIPPQATSAFSQGMGALRNPEQLLQSALPPEISQQMQNISQIPGLGFVGNLGFSVGDTLDSLSDGVFTAALDQFADKAGILGPLFNKQTTPPDVDNQEAYTDAFGASKVRQDQQTAQGITAVADSTPWKIFPSEEPRKSSAITAYGITEGLNGTVSGPGFSYNPQTKTTTAYGITERIR